MSPVVSFSRTMAVPPTGGGGLVDGGTATITGTGFGTNSGIAKLWTGGINSAVETGANDDNYNSVSPAAFKMSSISSPNNFWRISTARTYGRRAKSMLWDTTDARNNTVSNIGQACMVWSPGLAQLGSSYSAFKMYIEVPNAATDVQVKTQRFISQYTNEGSTGISDGDGNNCLLSNRLTGADGLGAGNFEGYFGNNGGATFPPFSSSATFFTDAGWGDTGSPATCLKSGWYELEVEFSDSSTLSSSDAFLSHKLRRLSDGAIVGSHVRPNVQIYAGAGTRWKYINMQLGCFNGTGSGINEGGNVKVSILDLFHGGNTRSRIRLSNNATYSSATISEPCDWSSWSNTSIGVSDVNQGAHPSLTGLFWHVWDSTGTLVNPTTGIPA